MKINNKLKSIASRYPSLSLTGYNILKKYWHLKSGFINYEYPEERGIATVSYTKVLDYNKTRPFGPKKRICYAPFNNLHFQMNGDVCSCSFNYDFTLGNIFNQTVSGIWFGEKAKNFRETLADFNLDKCVSCKLVLESGNYSSFPPLKYDIHSDDHAKYPTQMSFELSNLCNYECVMCNEDFSSLIRKSKNLPPLKYNYPENFVEQLAEFIPHLSVATFIGGEPMLIKSYYKIWEAIIKINPRCTIHIQTNGSILTEKFLELIDSGQFEIGVSIDAPTKATFEMIRLRADFDEVEKNILILREYAKQGKIYMNFNFCPLTINWKEIPEMIEYANKMDITLKLVNVQYPAHLALQHRDSAYLTKVYEELSNYRFSASGSSVISKMNGRTFDHFLKNVSYYKEESLKWESFLSEHIPQSLDNITRILYDQVYSIKNFETFATAEKDKIFQEMCGYIYSKSNDEAVLRNIFMRIIYSFKLTEHEGDNNMSGNLEAGFSIFKRIADGFYDLENELKEAECKIA